MIGIHAPYAFTDTTAMALSLADLVASLAGDPSFLSYQSHEQGVHSVWDKTAMSEKRRDFRDWLRQCSHIIWFGNNSKKVLMARRYGCKNILIVQPDHLNEEDLDALDYYEQVFCSSFTVYQKLKERCPTAKLFFGFWDPGVPIRTRWPGPAEADWTSFLLIMPGRVADRFGSDILFAMRELVEHHKNVRVTLLHTRQWNMATMDAMTQLKCAGEDRVTILRKANYHQRQLAYAKHDWTIYPTLGEGCDHFAWESLCNCTPIVAFDLPIWFLHAKNSVVIPTLKVDNWLGLQQAVPRSSDILQTLTDVVDDQYRADDVRQALNDAMTLYHERRKGYRQYWSKTLDLPT